MPIHAVIADENHALRQASAAMRGWIIDRAGEVKSGGAWKAARPRIVDCSRWIG
jgi:hypothetical protein